MQNNLAVNVNNISVGKLTEENNQYIFSYKTQSEEFISLTMQPRTQQYLNNRLHPLFEMHLPEGYLLSIIKKHFSKLTKTDDFGLLKLMSANVNGRITYELVQNSRSNILSLDELINPVSDDLFEELVSRYALSSPLSGVQPKILADIKNKATLQVENYIVKSWGTEYPELAINEYYSMLVVKNAGIEVPEFYLSSDDKLFIMKRFDIQDDGVKLGFEDMCVLQAKQRDDKYEGSYEQIVKTIKTFVSPKNKRESLQQFYKMMVINNILQNGDAHLKNYGLLYSDISNIKLAPAYDVVSTTAYIKNDIPALHLLGSKKWWGKKYLMRFGVESCDLSKSEAMKLYEECIIAAQKIVLLLDKRINTEEDKSKLIILRHINGLLSNIE